MVGDLLPLLAVLVGGVVGFLSSALSQLVSAGQAHESWVRDRRAAVYEAYFTALQEAADVVNEVDYINLPRQDVDAARRKLDQASAKLPLYASNEVSRAANDVRRVYADWAEFDDVNGIYPMDDGYDFDLILGMAERFNSGAAWISDIIRSDLGIDTNLGLTLPQRIAERFKKLF